MVPSSGKSSSFTSSSMKLMWPSVLSTTSKPGLISSSGSGIFTLMVFTLLRVSWFPIAFIPFTAMNSSILIVSGSRCLSFSFAKTISAVAPLATITCSIKDFGCSVGKKCWIFVVFSSRKRLMKYICFSPS